MSKIKISAIKLRFQNKWEPEKTEPTPTYKVEAVTDSIEFHPGQVLDREKVQALCGDRFWKVTVV